MISRVGSQSNSSIPSFHPALKSSSVAQTQLCSLEAAAKDSFCTMISKSMTRFVNWIKDLFSHLLGTRPINSQWIVSAEQWASASPLNLPPYPPELIAFLEAECTIWPGQTRRDTHIVVPLFPQCNITGSPQPFTLKALHRLDRSSGGPGCKSIYCSIPEDAACEQEFHYAVMTKKLIPGSRMKTYEEKLKTLPAGYEVPGFLDVARALLWENRRSGTRYLCDPDETCDDTALTYTVCKESFPVSRVADRHCLVGDFSEEGLAVTLRRIRHDHEDFGIVGWRKF